MSNLLGLAQKFQLLLPSPITELTWTSAACTSSSYLQMESLKPQRQRKIVPISQDLQGRPFPSTPMSHLFLHLTSYLERSSQTFLESFLRNSNAFASGSVSKYRESGVNHCVLSNNSYEIFISSACTLQALQEVTVILGY